MTPKYMLDTNICIYLMKNQLPDVGDRFKEFFVGEIVISAITLAELEYGVSVKGGEFEKRNSRALSSLIEDILVAPFDHMAAKSYGPLRAIYQDRTRDALDKLIASHAVSLGVTLVTNNESDFMNYPGLKVENWVNH